MTYKSIKLYIMYVCGREDLWRSADSARSPRARFLRSTRLAPRAQVKGETALDPNQGVI